MTRVLVCGGRDFNDEERVFGVLNSYDHEYGFTRVIHGGARGADRAAMRWADIGGVVVQCFKPNWKKHGKAAGPIRNTRMIEEGRPDLVIAFPGGRGTANMVAQARAAGVEVIEITK